MQIWRLVITILSLWPLLGLAAPLVHEYSLDNGLKLIVKVDKRAPVLTSMVWYKVGASYEPNGLTGISHMLEHMMFQGTQAYPTGQFSTLIAENGGQQNAFTGADYTAYYQNLAADKLALSFELEADRMQNLSLKEADFAKELQVVMEERRLRTDDVPEALTYERFAAAAFIANPYHHPIIGWMNDLQNLRLADVNTWYQTWYAPNNATVVVVGDVVPEQVLALAKKYFAAIPQRMVPALKPQQEVAGLGERRVLVKVPAQVPTLIMGYNVPVIRDDQSSDTPYVLSVINALLSGGNSARLEKNVVRKQQIASAAYADYDPFARFSTVFILGGTPAQQHSLNNLEAALFTQIKELQTTLVDESELARVKAQIIAAKIFAQDSLTYQAMEIGLLETIGLSWQAFDTFVAKVQEVRPQQIQQVAQQYLIAERLTVAHLQPLALTAAANAAGASHVQ